MSRSNIQHMLEALTEAGEDLRFVLTSQAGGPIHVSVERYSPPCGAVPEPAEELASGCIAPGVTLEALVIQVIADVLCRNARLERDGVGVTLSYIGEGYHEDYNADDPEDQPLLRVDVDQLTPVGWDTIERSGSSVCTLLPVCLSRPDQATALERLMDIYHDVVLSGESLHHAADEAAGLGPDDLVATTA